MNLTVHFERRSHESSETVSPNQTDCFASLPSAVAASLWNIKPHASLIILNIRHKASTSSKEETTIFVAWTGDTISQPDGLGINPLFALSVNLREGQVVEVLVTERVLANSPKVKVISATLRPLSYQDDSSGGVTTTSEQRSLARDQYNCLSETADILEATILPQIRVLYHGLRFPVSLPAKDYIQVEVTHLNLSSDNDTNKYGVLVPGTELLIEPPPPDPDENGAMKVNKKFRLIPFSDSLQNIRHSLLLTHAVLPEEFSTSVDVRAAHVSRKPPRDADPLLPVVFLCRSTIPNNHVWLPPSIWHDLRLAPLQTVSIQEVSMFPQGPGVVQIVKAGNTDPNLPSFDNISQAHGVVYHGMQLRNGTLFISDSHEALTPVKSSSSNEPSVMNDEHRISEVMAEWEGTDKWRGYLKDTLGGQRSKLKPVRGWRMDTDQTISVPADRTSVEAPTADRNEADVSRFNPMFDDILRMQLAEGLTRLSRTAVHEAMIWARETLGGSGKDDKIKASSILLISGPEGSGKTMVCKTLATILRSVALLRTVWIRCFWENEKDDSLVKRLQRAYDEAIDGGRGLVVVEDIDFWIGDRRLANESNSEEAKKHKSSSLLVSEILRRMRMARCQSVLSVITCRNGKDLENCFRAPGVIGKKISLELPGRADMTILRWATSRERKNRSDINFDDLTQGSESAFEGLSPSLEGYNAKEVQLLYRRAFSKVKPGPKIAEEDQIVEYMQKLVSELTPGGMAKRPHSGRQQIMWAWSKIGGAKVAKKALTEVLLWPSKRQDLFHSSPLSLPRGVLLYGPPGCGKTLLAKAAAQESRMRSVVVKGPELMSKYIGESEASVRRAFEMAQRLRPCVILFDEFDALAPRRGSGTGVTDRIVNTLLTCLDGAERLSEGVYLIATTSRPELIDPAVLRPGRIDRWVPVDIPSSTEERYDILKRLSDGLFKLTDALDTALMNVSRVTEEYSGADLGAVLNDARVLLRKVDKVSDDAVVEAVGEALRNSRPSLSNTERVRFKRVMERFGRDGRDGVEGKGERVALQ